MCDQVVFNCGDQIAYIPLHADGDITHKDVEFGFVTSVRDDTVFCRYWNRWLGALRTLANSEATPIDRLVHHESVSQQRVDETLEWIENQWKKS